MKNLIFIFLTLFIFVSLCTKAGEPVTSKQLAGGWKITDVKSSKQKEGKVTSCYLCDLYTYGAKLVFTEDGKVAYEDDRNPVKVFYRFNNNDEIVFYTRPGAPAVAWSATSQDENTQSFKINLKNDVLTLQLVTPDFTETYTLNK